MSFDIHAAKAITKVIVWQRQIDSAISHASYMESKTRIAVASNIDRLRKQRGWSQTTLAEKAGIGQASVSYLTRTDTKSPTITTLDAVAAAFGVEPYTLLIPSPNVDENDLKEVDLLVNSYYKAPAEGRKQIRRVAEAEARYGEPKSKD